MGARSGKARSACGMPGTAQFFVSLGLPGWLAYVTTFVELIGGIALLLGEHPGALETLLAERPDNALSRPLPNLQLGLPGDLARERPDI
ncbi:DoxX family membrane protein, partial [Pseudomonas sp. SIMBA_041]|uniref:DoxX family protein n=1 Tax=Pseudomonas sp. SIMBA_041 TaxID=3085782 RepID=UPI00397B993F